MTNLPETFFAILALVLGTAAPARRIRMSG